MVEYGFPTWGSYFIFAIVTIFIGAILGLVSNFIYILDLYDVNVICVYYYLYVFRLWFLLLTKSILQNGILQLKKQKVEIPLVIKIP